MKKILIIPISILLLTACASVQAPTVQTPIVQTPPVQPEEQKITQEIENQENKITTPDSGNNKLDSSIKDEKTSDGWTKTRVPDMYTTYTGKTVEIKGKVVEVEVMGTWKYHFCVSEDNFENLPAEFVDYISKESFLKCFSIYFNKKAITDNYKDKIITVTPESITKLSEGTPNMILSKLPKVSK